MMKRTKVVTIFTITTTIIALISASFNFLLPMCISYIFRKEVREASSIGIIGGADGPTAIFLAKQTSSHFITIIFSVLSIVGVLYLFFARKATK